VITNRICSNASPCGLDLATSSYGNVRRGGSLVTSVISISKHIYNSFRTSRHFARRVSCFGPASPRRWIIDSCHTYTLTELPTQTQHPLKLPNMEAERVGVCELARPKIVGDFGDLAFQAMCVCEIGCPTRESKPVRVPDTLPSIFGTNFCTHTHQSFSCDS
jgi:hypothetical protein